MDQLAQVLQEIQQRRRFLVTSHARPDGDAIGSTLALAQILRKMGKTAAEVVLRRVRNKSSKSEDRHIKEKEIVVEPELIVRESTCKVRTS